MPTDSEAPTDSSYRERGLVDRILGLVSTFHHGNDYGGILSPPKRPRVSVGFCKKAFDGFLKRDDGAECGSLLPQSPTRPTGFSANSGSLDRLNTAILRG